MRRCAWTPIGKKIYGFQRLFRNFLLIFRSFSSPRPCGSGREDHLNVEEPLKLVVIEPKCQIVREGESATFEIKDLKGGSFSYQWEKNAQLIPGANSATYIIQNVSIEDAGGYRLIVSNSCCSIKSNMVVLKVTEAALRCVCPTPPKPPKNFTNYTDYQNIGMGAACPSY